MSQNPPNLAPLPAIGTQATLSRTITEDDILLFALVSGDHNPIYLGQTLKFLAPIHIGDTVTVTVKVVAIREDKRIITLHTDCTNQHGTLVLSGEATVKYMREAEAA